MILRKHWAVITADSNAGGRLKAGAIVGADRMNELRIEAAQPQSPIKLDGKTNESRPTGRTKFQRRSPWCHFGMDFGDQTVAFGGLAEIYSGHVVRKNHGCRPLSLIQAREAF